VITCPIDFISFISIGVSSIITGFVANRSRKEGNIFSFLKSHIAAKPMAIIITGLVHFCLSVLTLNIYK
jgi:hypothetical protein